MFKNKRSYWNQFPDGILSCLLKQHAMNGPRTSYVRLLIIDHWLTQNDVPSIQYLLTNVISQNICPFIFQPKTKGIKTDHLRAKNITQCRVYFSKALCFYPTWLVMWWIHTWTIAIWSVLGGMGWKGRFSFFYNILG